MFNIFRKNCVIYEIMWKNIIELDRSQVIIWRMHIVCWITKATDIHLEYVIVYIFISHSTHSCKNTTLC
jgi:hypothetical protein